MRFPGWMMLVALGCLLAQAAQAQECGLKMVNTVPMRLTPNGARALLPVTINGTPETFLLDTGGYATQISAKAALALKLPTMESNVKMLDMYGHASTTAVRIDTFVLGRMQDRNTVMPVLTNLFSDEAPFVGLVAADYMGRYDIELDFTGGKMNYFSTDHCEGKVIYWPATVWGAVPMTLRDNHLTLSVTLDGHPVRAMIDTGAPDTTLGAGEARRLFDLTADSQGAKVLGDESGHKVFSYVFHKLAFEGLEVNNPHIVIMPDLVGSKDANNNYVTGSHISREDDPDSSEPTMLVGMNILTKLHLYIAFKEGKIYITPAAPAASPAQ